MTCIKDMPQHRWKVDLGGLNQKDITFLNGLVAIMSDPDLEEVWQDFCKGNVVLSRDRKTGALHVGKLH